MHRLQNRLLLSITSVLAICLIIPATAHAYIDLGSGSYMLQIVIATALGGLFALKRYWRGIVSRIRGFFSVGKKP